MLQQQLNYGGFSSQHPLLKLSRHGHEITFRQQVVLGIVASFLVGLLSPFPLPWDWASSTLDGRNTVGGERRTVRPHSNQMLAISGVCGDRCGN